MVIVGNSIAFARRIVEVVSTYSFHFVLLLWDEFSNSQKLTGDFLITDTSELKVREKLMMLKHPDVLTFKCLIYMDVEEWLINDTNLNCVFLDPLLPQPEFKLKLQEALGIVHPDENTNSVQITHHLQQLRIQQFKNDFTDEELKIFSYLYNGKTEKEIAQLLNLSKRTYERRQCDLAKKCNVQNIRELIVQFAVRNGMDKMY
jgi:DNA-binding CsgD family transcriptional regulator